ncbi:MAG: hypothetical protein Q7S57_00445 [bacterium]|nr:hypothetical protein [bacterium]
MKPKSKTKQDAVKADDNQKYFIAINQELNSIRSEMATKVELRDMEERIFQHFDVSVEKIESSLRGANSDHISLLDEKKNDHEVRITTLEVRAGLRSI